VPTAHKLSQRRVITYKERDGLPIKARDYRILIGISSYVHSLMHGFSSPRWMQMHAHTHKAPVRRQANPSPPIQRPSNFF